MAVRSSIDITRLSKAVERPGVDPRVWLTLAAVIDVAFDAKFGMFADVQTMPDGDIETCLIGSSYVGDDFGAFFPLKVHDIVLVAIPYGDTGMGPTIIAKMWSTTAKPPPEFGDESTAEPTDATSNPTIVVESGATLRIVARDGANVSIESSGSGKIKLTATGDSQIEVTGESAVIVDSPDVRLGDSAGQPIARIGDLVAGPGLSIVTPVPTSPGVWPVTPVPATPVNPPVVGQIISGKSGVKA